MIFFRKKGRRNTGFSLIELMITLGIFVLLSGAVLANYRSIDNSLLLSSLANKVALSIREAQVSGTATKEFNGSFMVGYGVNFTLANDTRYVSFVDSVNPNKRLDSGETLETYTLGTGYTIVDICGNGKTTPPGDCGMKKIDITFMRPNPDAAIKGTKSNNTTGTYSDAEITLQSKNGNTKKVVVWVTGQISIE